MKNLIFLLALLIVTSCGTTQTITPDVEDSSHPQTFSIIKPEKWRAYKNHEHESYTPLTYGANPYHNLVSVFQYELKTKIAFNQFVNKKIKETNNSKSVIRQKSYSEQNRLGLVYIHEIESLFQGEVYKSFYMYFEHHGYYYNYNYSSREDLFQTYFTDAMSILNSIEFEKKN